MLEMEYIASTDTFWICEDGRCYEYRAFGDAYYEAGNIIALYGLKVATGEIVRFVMNTDYPQLAPTFYGEDQHGREH